MTTKNFDMIIFLSSVGTLPASEFTAELKDFEKQYKYGRVPLRDARRVYETCAKILNANSSSNDAYYNALRLLKHTVWNIEIFKNHYSDIWNFCEKTILHHNGNIRMAGATLISYFYLGATVIRVPVGRKRNKIHTAEDVAIENFWVQKIIEMMALEETYTKEHERKLYISDIGDVFHAPHSTETRDPLLKSIRCGIEELTRGSEFVDKMMNDHGYCMKRSSTFPDLIFWGRWATCTHAEHRRILCQQEQAGLWGEDVPYSQVHIEKEIRILGNQVSRTFVEICSYLNPTTRNLLMERLTDIPSEWRALLERAEDMGFEHGYRLFFGRYQLLDGDEKETREREKEATDLICAMHSFAMDMLNKRDVFSE